ncbi:MAG: cytochrome c-type biogenesis protein [Gammaproteobacteria bacterium]
MKIIFLILLIIPLQLFAAEDFYHFNSSAEQIRFTQLTTQLRCLVCQNQNLAESNAPLATDLRDHVYAQLMRGQSDKQIVDYLVARYGDFILYRPPLNGATLGLWFGPFLFLILALGWLFSYIRRRRPAVCPRDPVNLASVEEK